jgi:hypothetical protein
MTESINSLKELAHQVLMKKSFRYINKLACEEFTELASKNAKLRGVTTSFFLCNGDIYPKDLVREFTLATIPLAPALHYTLFEEFDDIVKRSNETGTNEISNYFRAVLSNSTNGIVLDELLPTILVNHLREFFDDREYELINFGVSNLQSRWEPITATRKNIEDIKNHYVTTINILRNLLMNKFLLQG